MTNGQLVEKLELCRAAVIAGQARATLWETWADGELEAQRKGTQ